MGYGGRLTAHDFRSTASTLLHEMGYRPETIERQLAHKEPNTIRRAYNKAQYLEERKAMMTHWADYLDGLCAGGAVVPIKAAG